MWTFEDLVERGDEGWNPASARHPAWSVCPAPVVVLVAIDALHEVDYRVAWVHHPTVMEGD